MTSSARFLKALYSATPDGCIEIRCFKPKAPGSRGAVQTFIRIAELAAGAWGVNTSNPDADGDDVYVGIATRRDATSGALANTAQLTALFVDLDSKYGETAVRERLAAFPLPPSVTVRSGGGLHTYWLLDMPLAAQAPETATALRRLAHAPDGVCDKGASEPARVLRLPGTVNRKYDPPCPVELETCEPTHRYALDALTAVCPPAPVEGTQSTWRPRVVSIGDVVVAPNTPPVLDMAEEFRKRHTYRRHAGKGKHDVICPWAHEHPSESAESATALFEPKPGAPRDLWGFECLHDHCRHRRIGDVYRLWNLGPSRSEPQGASSTINVTAVVSNGDFAPLDGGYQMPAALADGVPVVLTAARLRWDARNLRGGIDVTAGDYVQHAAVTFTSAGSRRDLALSFPQPDAFRALLGRFCRDVVRAERQAGLNTARWLHGAPMPTEDPLLTPTPFPPLQRKHITISFGGGGTAKSLLLYAAGPTKPGQGGQGGSELLSTTRTGGEMGSGASTPSTSVESTTCSSAGGAGNGGVQ